MQAAPITLAQANAYVESFHRHNGRLPAAKFAIAAIDSSGLVHGIAIGGLPKSRNLMDGATLEVNRVCTDGAWNCCSFLYGHCKRAAQALGYRRVVTYTLASEPGTSLKASGWERVSETKSDTWTRGRGTGYGLHDEGPKVRWEIQLGDSLPMLVWPEGSRGRQLSLEGIE